MNKIFTFMRCLVAVSFLSLTSCSSWGGDIKDKIEETEIPHKAPDLGTAEGQREKLTLDLGATMRWGAIACVIATIVLFVLSFKIQALAHLCVFTGSGAVLCMITIYSLSYIWFIAGAIFWGLVIYAGFKIYHLIQERNEERELSKELAIHFDDNEGEAKLSERAKEKYIENRKFGDIHKWDKEEK
ncbi:hypothetical protein DRO61_03890 [Candidatus Bathyarchaeota archaeon]|nr:MAG: hypothetical protein DRO61_03890 [Candidatus Bathyarchaeota archaeon]